MTSLDFLEAHFQNWKKNHFSQLTAGIEAQVWSSNVLSITANHPVYQTSIMSNIIFKFVSIISYRDGPCQWGIIDNYCH